MAQVPVLVTVILRCIMLLVAAITISGCGIKQGGLKAPVHLTCEYQQEPLGLDAKKPRFSWWVNDDRRNAVQSAYQIQVAASAEKLAAGIADVWDSGKQVSDQSVHVVYNGPALQSRMRYFWRVRTWDGNDMVSPWSSIHSWEMGLLQRDDWQASWIGRKKEAPPKPTKEKWPWGYWVWHPTEKRIEKKTFYRKPFDIVSGKVVTHAVLRATADNYFTAFVNGNEIGGGEQWENVYEFDITSQIKSGRNVLAIAAANTLGDVCGLIASLKVEFSDGSSLLVNTDKTWRTSRRIQNGWQSISFRDDSWQWVKVLYPYEDSEWGLIDGEDPYIPPRSTMLRKDFNAGQRIKRARLYVTGLGGFVVFLNGQRVGNDLFTPGWTDYPTRIQYQTYDVTELVQQGANAVGAILGNLWWSGGLGWKGSQVYSDGPLQLFLQLEIMYEDGSRDQILSDGTWRTHLSPILENSIYHGETYDARLEMPGWARTGFDDGDWDPVLVLPPQSARLVARQGPAIQVTEELIPISVTPVSDSSYVFDMGQNMVGRVQLRVKGPAGTRVRLRFAEILNDDGTLYTENLRSARATDYYILKGKGKEIWAPLFTYHGFRYVEVTGYPGVPDKHSILGQVFHSNAPVAGSFACSNELINRIQQNITWGLRGNMHSVPTDCPQRDERLGWMGDAQIFSPTACYNRNMARFFTKWMRDITDCQEEDGAVYDVNPAIVVKGPAKPGWGDAVVIIPWMVYQFYGDKQIIRENYDSMVAWVEYMKRHARNYIYDRKGYGDWVAVVASPSEPIGAAYFCYSTRLLARMAAIIGEDADAKKYSALAEKITFAFNKKYFNVKTGWYHGNTQAANLLPVAFGITPPEKVHRVMENVVKDIRQRNNHLSTGFLGTAYILPMLSKWGYHKLAWKLATQRSYPSWGYMVEQGATTIWELWNSDTEGPGMNSRNHFALGSVGEWYYAYLAGLQPDPERPGFRHVVVAPHPIEGLQWAEASIQTMYGQLTNRWEMINGQFRLDISVPANCSAEVHIPVTHGDAANIMVGKTLFLDRGKIVTQVEGVRFKSSTQQRIVLYTGAGSYHIEVVNTINAN